MKMKENSIANRDGNILIVDDNKIERDILKGLLAKQGYSLAFAANGMEALDKASKLMPDLVMLDVMLPDMDGFEVCRCLRSDHILAEVPIVMITSLDDRKSRLAGIEAGADCFMTKPVDSIELQTYIRTIIRLNRYRQLLIANQALGNKIAQLTALYSILSLLNSTTDLDELLKSITKKSQELLNVEQVFIFLWDDNKNKLYPVLDQLEENPANLGNKTDTLAIFTLLAEQAFQKANPTLAQDIDFEEYANDNLKKKGQFVKSALCVPLKGKKGIIGILEAINKQECGFTADDQNMLEAMADNIAISIERANLYQNLHQTEALLRRQNAELRRSAKQKYSYKKIIGNSQNIISVLKKAEQVASTDSTVLIYGETGTGKELLAQAIHYSSPRSQKSFVPINCGAIPKELLESELFGHEKGAFTGAINRRIGRFEQADQGTLFLDEIGDMPLELQIRLLRVLQEGIIQRLGSNKDIKVDVRLIIATHKDLTELIQEGKFREDLYYRLKVFQLELPPLRERKSDIPLLINHFITYYNEVFNKQIEGLDSSAIGILNDYEYPGNIRELQYIIESAMILCKEKLITTDILPVELTTQKQLSKTIVPDLSNIHIPKNKEELNVARAEAQRQVEIMFLKEALSDAGGNLAEAARRTGMNRSWLSEMVSKHQLDLIQFRSVG